MRAALHCGLGLILAGCQSTGGQLAPAADPAPGRGLQGTWVGAGSVRDWPAEVRLEFRQRLAGRALALHFSNDMQLPDGKRWRFEAEAVYLCDADADAGERTCRGHWYDSRGTVLPLLARQTSQGLVVEWGDAATERGRTTYHLDGDTLHITDEVMQVDGDWRVFGVVRASRR